MKPSSPANVDKQDLPVIAKTEAVANIDEEIQPPAEETNPAKNKKATAQPAKKGKRGRKSIREMDAESAMISIPDDELLFKKQYYSPALSSSKNFLSFSKRCMSSKFCCAFDLFFFR